MHNVILTEQQVTSTKVNMKIAFMVLETIEFLGLFSIHWRKVLWNNDRQHKVSKIAGLIILDL